MKIILIILLYLLIGFIQTSILYIPWVAKYIRKTYRDWPTGLDDNDDAFGIILFAIMWPLISLMLIPAIFNIKVLLTKYARFLYRIGD